MALVRHDFIHGRDDFYRLLEELVVTARALDRRCPGLPQYISIRRQLEALTAWTRDGEPSLEQRRSLTMGRIAARELDSDFADKLIELDFYVSHWLDDVGWITLDNEDLWTFAPEMLDS